MADGLTQADVEHLLTEPSTQTQAQTAAKIAKQFRDAQLSEKERELASDIFRTLARGAELMVREVLGAELNNSRDLPHDIALSLARDVDSVALPVLRSSEVLSDADLVEIVSQSGVDKQSAIAARPSVSNSVSDALIDFGTVDVVARLVGNEGAEIAETGFERVLSKHGESGQIGDRLSRRAVMPPAIMEKVVAAVSDRLQQYLQSRKDLSGDVAAEIILQARERAVVDLALGGRDAFAVERLVEQLYRQRRLTASLLFRTLCFGDLAFFELAVSCLSNVSLSNTRILLHEGGELAFKSIYDKAGLPARLQPAFHEALKLRDEMDVDGGPDTRHRFHSQLLERTLTAFEGDQSLSHDDVEFLMEKLSHMAA